MKYIVGIQLTVIWAHIGMSPKKPSYPGFLEILAYRKVIIYLALDF